MNEVEQIFEEEQIEYKATGSGYLIRCINPEHEDVNPSMLVNKVTGHATCLSCNFRTNVVEYYNRTVNFLTRKRNMLSYAILQRMNEAKKPSMPENWVPFAGAYRGISGKTLREFGAFISPEEPSRITFPIKNLSNEIVAFIGRHMDDGDPKYKVWPSGVSLPLFPVAKPHKGRILLVEGIFDALNLWDKGVTNVTAAFGANKVDEDKLDLLSLQGTEGIDILFDGDTPGREAARKVHLKCKEKKINSRIIKIEDGKDPGNLTADEVNNLRKKLYK